MCSQRAAVPAGPNKWLRPLAFSSTAFAVDEIVVGQRIRVRVSATQSYTYDAFQRLLSATEPASPGFTGWTQSYGYDQYGNRWVSPSSYLPSSPATPTSASNYSTSNNRLVSWSGNTIAYDSGGTGNGNLTTAGSFVFSYDGENRQVSAAVPMASTGYVYDGEGRRVQKLTCPSTVTPCTATQQTAGTAVTYVYDAQGQMVAEYGGTSSGTGSEGTQYLMADELGSTRLLTDPSGTVEAYHDYRKRPMNPYSQL